MDEAVAYFFPKNKVRRIDMSYFVCWSNRMAELNIPELRRRYPEISDETINDIKRDFKEELHFKLQNTKYVA
ncbi:MAG: hypothetical protein AAB732_01565 [Patescibacteria group bacterium]